MATVGPFDPVNVQITDTATVTRIDQNLERTQTALEAIRTGHNALQTAFDAVPFNTLEAFQDAVAAMLVGGTHSGITVTYDDAGGVINLNLSGVTPPLQTPNVSGFSINIPDTVNTNTDLNDARQITYTISSATSISSLTLVVTTGTDQVLSVPILDGTYTQNVTLAGINTTSAGTITFQIRGTTTGGQTIMSNIQTVQVRVQAADELAYYGIRSTNDFASVDLANLTSVDVQRAASSYTISGSWPATQFLGILEPADRPITSIVDSQGRETFSGATNRWSNSDGIRQINGQGYDLIFIRNNGATGNFSFTVTHG